VDSGGHEAAAVPSSRACRLPLSTSTTSLLRSHSYSRRRSISNRWRCCTYRSEMALTLGVTQRCGATRGGRRRAVLADDLVARVVVGPRRGAATGRARSARDARVRWRIARDARGMRRVRACVERGGSRLETASGHGNRESAQAARETGQVSGGRIRWSAIEYMRGI
jgi:hypothetical protein